MDVKEGEPRRGTKMDDQNQRLYLTVLRGPSPSRATPVLATENQDLIRRVAQMVADDVGREQPPLELVADEEGGNRE